MVWRSRELKENIWWEKVPYETIENYRRWTDKVRDMWVAIRWIVCDGRRWLLWWFGDIPTQMCHFHQKQIVIRNITKRPKLEANKELGEIVELLGKIESEHWLEWLNDWYRRRKEWLHEKNEQGWYIHIRTIRAYGSLKNNFQYLFLYEKYPWLPNTTNSLEATFSRLKEKLWNHRWLSEKRKQKFIQRYLNH